MVELLKGNKPTKISDSSTQTNPPPPPDYSRLYGEENQPRTSEMIQTDVTTSPMHHDLTNPQQHEEEKAHMSGGSSTHQTKPYEESSSKQETTHQDTLNLDESLSSISPSELVIEQDLIKIYQDQIL